MLVEILENGNCQFFFRLGNCFLIRDKRASRRNVQQTSEPKTHYSVQVSLLVMSNGFLWKIVKTFKQNAHKNMIITSIYDSDTIVHLPDEKVEVLPGHFCSVDTVFILMMTWKRELIGMPMALSKVK